MVLKHEDVMSGKSYICASSDKLHGEEVIAHSLCHMMVPHSCILVF